MRVSVISVSAMSFIWCETKFSRNYGLWPIGYKLKLKNGRSADGFVLTFQNEIRVGGARHSARRARAPSRQVRAAIADSNPARRGLTRPTCGEPLKFSFLKLFLLPTQIQQRPGQARSPKNITDDAAGAPGPDQCPAG
jgi:hypothetical protein